MCTVIDNSSRIAMEKRLAESEAELRRVTDAVPMLISYVDQDHLYRFAITLSGVVWYEPEDMIGKHMALCLARRLPKSTPGYRPRAER